MKRMVERNKKQEGILIFPKVYIQTSTCSCLPTLSTPDPPFYKLVLGKISSASRDTFTEPIYKLRVSFVNISARAKNPKFLVD